MDEEPTFKSRIYSDFMKCCTRGKCEDMAHYDCLSAGVYELVLLHGKLRGFATFSSRIAWIQEAFLIGHVGPS